MMKKILPFIILLFILSCSKERQHADIIITNAKVYTVNSNFDTVEAFAIKDGKFIGVGKNKEIQK